MTASLVPQWDVGHYGSIFNNTGATLPPNIALVSDSGADRAGKRPANGANTSIVDFKGITRREIADQKDGDVAIHVGDLAVGTANGAITRGDTVFVTSADAGKEGYAKKYTNFGADGVVFILGVAETTAADGELVEIRLQGLYIKTA